MDILVLAPMLGLAIVFVLVATRMWRHSIATVIHGVTSAIAISCYADSSPEFTISVIATGVLLNMVRGVITTDKDKFIKRKAEEHADCPKCPFAVETCPQDFQ